ncbi:MAG: NUDIX domain-containing protein [bacterium]|nr:NUDIX domain-containing protein [bacterium]
MKLAARGIMLDDRHKPIEQVRILLIKEKNKWRIPGGKALPGETPSDVVWREVFEETHLSVQPHELLAYSDVYQNHKMTSREAFFISEVIGGELKNSKNVRWLPINSIPSFPKYCKWVLRRLRAKLRTEQVVVEPATAS